MRERESNHFVLLLLQGFALLLLLCFSVCLSFRASDSTPSPGATPEDLLSMFRLQSSFFCPLLHYFSLSSKKSRRVALGIGMYLDSFQLKNFCK
jgi:hypothetical protein